MTEPTNVFLLGAPRSGAGLMARELTRGTGWAHSRLSSVQLLDGVPGCGLVERRFESHVLGADDASDEVRTVMMAAAREHLDGSGDDEPGDDGAGGDGTVGAGGPKVAVDWNPAWSLRLGLVHEVFPDAKFVLVVRSPLMAVGSLVNAWRSQRFVTVPDLPGWWGDPWSFPLVPEWRDLIGTPLHQVAATQWASITDTMLDGLAQVPATNWAVTVFDEFLADPRGEIERVTGELGLDWEGEVPETLGASATAVNDPAAQAWRHHLGETAQLMGTRRYVTERLSDTVRTKKPEFVWPDLPPEPERDAAGTTTVSDGTPYAATYTPSVPDLLRRASSSLVVSTYKSGHVILARASESGLDTEFVEMDRPMGIAVSGERMAVGTADSIVSLASTGVLSEKVTGVWGRPVDAAFAPLHMSVTGDVAIHDMAYGADNVLYFVNTKFSCLCRQDMDYSFVPVWRPEWISELVPEDRCHLNGLAMRDGIARYVTALARTDTEGGWRTLKGTSGVIVDISTDQEVCEGLAMPHSPRWHDGRLWVLESGKGTLSTVDLATGALTEVATLPGFTRGLSFIGKYALVGLSQVRESVFSALPITKSAAERNCGVWVVDTERGEVVGYLKFEGMVEEIFEVQVLRATWPVVLDTSPETQSSYVLPAEVVAEMNRERQ